MNNKLFAAVRYTPVSYWELDARYVYLGSTEKLPHYRKLDVNISFKQENLRYSLGVKHLLKDKHVEPNPDSTRANSNIDRRVHFSVTYTQ